MISIYTKKNGQFISFETLTRNFTKEVSDK